MVTKTREEAKANYEASIAYIPERYIAGVQKADWLGPASSEQAEKNYATSIGKAVANKSRQKGIRNVSNSEWQDAAVTKGAPIIGDRIRLSLDKWEQEWGPMYDQVVAKVATLPAKTTDWRNNINSRLVPVVAAWKKAAGKS